MAARKGNNRQPAFLMSDAHRIKIQNSNILNALIEHAEGSIEMSSTRVSAALGLLKKVLPDLQAVELSGGTDNTHEHRHMTMDPIQG